MNFNEKVSYLLGKDTYDFDDLCTVMTVLRSEGGCPWDREQTHESIRNDFIEETYEVIEAIDTKDPVLLREELGDVLLQVVFHARIEEEEGGFNINDVANDICVKLIHRHPHIFSDVKVKNSDEVLKNWDAIKSVEKSRETLTSRLRSVPPMLPALMRARKVGKKASMLDFPNIEAVYEKLYEEIGELREAEAEGSKENMHEEMGDILLTVASLARKLGIDPEKALSDATNKFIDRFEKVENEASARGIDMEKSSVEVLDKIYDEIK